MKRMAKRNDPICATCHLPIRRGEVMYGSFPNEFGKWDNFHVPCIPPLENYVQEKTNDKRQRNT